MTKSIPEMSADTRFLYQMMKDATPGQTLTYTELSKAIGRDVQEAARSNLRSARLKCRSEGIEFGVIASQGLKRLNDEEIVATGDYWIEKSRRTSKRGIRVLHNAKYEKLSPEARIKHNAAVSVLGVMALFGKPKTLQKVEGAVTASQSELPLAKTLELFR